MGRLRRASLARRALPSEVRASHDRPRGFKVARLTADPASETGGFLGLTVGGRYGSDATAVCEIAAGSLPPPRRWGRRCTPTAHPVPDVKCSCGFYSYRDRRDAETLLATSPPATRVFGTALLDVDLAGAIIECDRGFRSSHQRVLGVHLPGFCLPCAADGRTRRANQLAGWAGRQLAAALQEEVPHQPRLYRLAKTLHYQALMAHLDGWAALRPVCDDHLPAESDGDGHAQPTAVVCEPAGLAARLGTEVSWLPDGGFDVRAYVETLSWASRWYGYATGAPRR
jgi:hypothetical protein